MDLDMLKKHALCLKHTDMTEYPRISIRLTKTIPPQEFQVNLYAVLEKYKNQIDKISNYRLWDFCKKLTNPFELIHSFEKYKNTNTGIAKYNPISRSYFKMWEIVHDFDLLDFNKASLNFLGIAEGPGGFIDCIYSMRERYCKTKPNDNCVCMSLKSFKNNIPGWKNSRKLFAKYSSIQIYYGPDGSGDLYEKQNIEGLYAIHARSSTTKADFVTADGGFDFSLDYNKQEQMAQRLIMCEIISAFSCLRERGHFVIKIFDLFSIFTLKIVYFLTIFFEQVYIVKPFTSRPANSEKYLVCKGFEGITEQYLIELLKLVDNWKILSEQNKIVTDIFDFDLPGEFVNAIKTYNYHIVSKQVETILKTLTFIKLDLNNTEVSDIRQKQALSACLWCKKYDFPVNMSCKYLQNSEMYNYIPRFT